MLLPAAMTLAGAVMSARGAAAAGAAAQRAANYNAMLAEQNAVLAGERAANDERQFRTAARKQLAGARTGVAASGFRMEGSVVDLMAEGLYAVELDAANIRAGGRAEEMQFRSEAVLLRMGGQAAAAAGRTQASATLLSGIGQSYYMANR